MALTGFTAQVDAAYFRSRLGTLARMWRDVADETAGFFEQYTTGADGNGDGALKLALLAAGFPSDEMVASNDVIYAMKNLETVYNGADFPPTNFGASIEPACGLV